MVCCVPNCTSEAAHTPQVKFPKEIPLRNRWQQLIQKGAGIKLASDQLQEICIKHFARPDNCAYQEPVLFTDSAGHPIKLATCRLCQKVQRESRMCQIGRQMAGESLTAVIFSTLRIRLKPSEFLQRLCLECLAKIDLIHVLQIRYSILELSYQHVAKMRASLEVIETAVMEQDQDVDNVPEDLTEYLEEEVCHEELLGPEVDVQKVLEQMDAANNSEKYDVQLDCEIEPEPLKNLSRPPKRKEQAVVSPLASDGVKPKRKYITQNRPRKSKPWSPKKKEQTLAPDGVKPKRKYKTQNRSKPPKRLIPLTDTGPRTCHICKKLFPRRDELLDHLLESHATPEGYACAECDGKTFETVILYNNHLKFHDAAERFYKCSVCAMRYCTRSTQRRHENLVHGMAHPIKILKKKNTNRLKYQCEQCGKMLSSQSTMDRHMQIHQGAVQCDLCNKTVPSASHLRTHKLRHVNEKPFRCTMCEKRYSWKHALKDHVIAVHEQKQAYQCCICKEAFNSRTEYRNHAWEAHALKNERDSHASRLRFKCLLCPEVSQLLSELEAHVEFSHADEEYPYQICELCPEKKFFAETALNLHQQSKHPPTSYVRIDRRRAAEELRMREDAAAVLQLLQSSRGQSSSEIHEVE